MKNEKKKKIIGLAPLAGISDLPYRLICFINGADYAVTEMVSCKALYYNSDKTEELLRTSCNEGKLSLQLFGNDPEILKKVIKEKINHREDFSMIDLNMGCPAPKIIKNGDGSALMSKPILVGKIIGAMVKASTKPVTVKFRLGIDDESKNFLEIGKIAENEGAEMVCLHGRTQKAMYSGKADWNAIAELKNELNIPVIGNGDVDSPEKAIKMFKETGCDGIAIGRAAIGNPFIFQQIKDYLEFGDYKSCDIENIFSTLLLHYKLEIEERGEHRAMLLMRKNFSAYISGLKGVKEARRIINQTDSFNELKQVIDNLRELNS